MTKCPVSYFLNIFHINMKNILEIRSMSYEFWGNTLQSIATSYTYFVTQKKNIVLPVPELVLYVSLSSSDI